LDFKGNCFLIAAEVAHIAILQTTIALCAFLFLGEYKILHTLATLARLDGSPADCSVGAFG
jgi:hypothetical protein